MIKYLTFVMIGLLPVFSVFGQYQVTVEPDSILCVEGQAKITVNTAQSNLDLNCIAKKGGGEFSDFKVIETADGRVNQAVFSSPFPGEVNIQVLDGKYTKIAEVTVTVIAPIIEILEDKMYDSINAQNKSMPLIVSVKDPKGNPISTAKLTTKISEIVNKKPVATNTKISEFLYQNGLYIARITNLKDASYKVEVYDENHYESFEKATNPDNPHPGTVIEGMNVAFD
jgi:hypothetical protein